MDAFGARHAQMGCQLIWGGGLELVGGSHTDARHVPSGCASRALSPKAPARSGGDGAMDTSMDGSATWPRE